MSHYLVEKVSLIAVRLNGVDIQGNRYRVNGNLFNVFQNVKDIKPVRI